ncbi:hypothetical protein EVA_18645 [gut metagenome]|uniref:Uncharacterized protein n=1 Tax=gut metagenome TaxID=749906 RepID=J9G0Z8_9ZZZZ
MPVWSGEHISPFTKSANAFAKALSRSEIASPDKSLYAIAIQF